jgi:hypothetical protein
MWGWAFSSRPTALAARSIIRAKPAVVNGDPRSLTKTKGGVGASRCSRRSARSSSPWIGGVLGVPFLTRRTCSTAPLTNSLQHLPCYVTGGRVDALNKASNVTASANASQRVSCVHRSGAVRCPNIVSLAEFRSSWPWHSPSAARAGPCSRAPARLHQLLAALVVLPVTAGRL